MLLACLVFGDDVISSCRAWLIRGSRTSTSAAFRWDRLLKPQKGDGPSRLASLASTNSSALRTHFRQLTAAFLEPFDSFMRPVGPPPGRQFCKVYHTALPCSIALPCHHRHCHVTYSGDFGSDTAQHVTKHDYAGEEPLPAEDPLPLPPFSHANFLDLLEKEHHIPAALLGRFSNKVLPSFNAEPHLLTSKRSLHFLGKVM